MRWILYTALGMLPGCGTFFNAQAYTAKQAFPFYGTVHDLAAVIYYFPYPYFILHLIDLPLSFVADTLMLVPIILISVGL